MPQTLGMNTYGQRLRDARKRKGLSQAALAKLAGCKQPTIFSIEHGDTQSTGLTVILSKILGVSPFWLEYGTLPREWKVHSLDAVTQEAVEIFEASDHDTKHQMLGAIKALRSIAVLASSNNADKRSA